MRVLVTGSNSPLGRSIVINLLETFKDCHIVALSRSDNDIKHPHVTNLIFDLCKNEFKVEQKFDLVVHTAALVPKTAKSDEEILDVNLHRSLELFKNIKFNKDSLIYNISTSSVYDDPFEEILLETSRKTAKDIYGLSKLRFELALEKLYKDSHVNLLNVRLPVLLVKGVKNNFISGWLDCIQAKRPMSLFNPESLFNACVHSEDIFKFLCTYLEKPIKKTLTCNLSSKAPLSIKETAKILNEELNTQFNYIEEQASRPSQLISNDLASIHGFEPRSVEDAIRNFGTDSNF